MRSIFILYIPQGNHEALVHYEDTIKKKISPESIFRFVNRDIQQRIKDMFGNRLVAVWGSRNSPANRSKFERMRPGDDILIVEGNTIKLLGKIAAKTCNPDLSKELWKNLKGNTTEGWDLIYFIANPLEINLPFIEFKKLFNYKLNWSLRGFTSVSETKLEEFYDRYDDLYSILMRIKQGETIEEKNKDLVSERDKADEYGITQEDIEQMLSEDELSKHLVMQWKLLSLGLKTGAKIWVPKSDQSRITKHYQYSEFEEEFTSGIDVPAKYVKNIDVVWKEEFRIDAAFEIENSTAIYSGLLRFSDLKIVAPNSNYPLFIVAPTSKKNRLIEQVKRPTFQKLQFHKKVRFLSYEKVEEIDKFFEFSTSGLDINLFVGKSEIVN